MVTQVRGSSAWRAGRLVGRTVTGTSLKPKPKSVPVSDLNEGGVGSRSSAIKSQDPRWLARLAGWSLGGSVAEEDGQAGMTG